MKVSLKLNTVYLSIFTVYILIIVCGSTFTWSSPTGPKLADVSTSPFGKALSIDEISWISSILGLGAALGPFIFGYIATKIGEKNTLLILGIPFLGSHLVMAFGEIVVLFYISRFITGLAVGGTFTTGLNYLAEMCNKNNRGVIMAIYSVSVCVGILLSYCLGPYVSIMLFNLTIAILSAVFITLFLIFGENSPRYLLSKDDVDKARDVLQKIKGTIDVEKDIADMKLNKEENSSGAFFEIFMSKGIIKVFCVSSTLFILQQCSGINIVYYYSQTIFKEAGTSLAPEICSIILGVDQFVSSIVTSSIIDLVGRKCTLMVSCVGVAISLLPLGIYDYLKTHHVDVSHVSFIPVVSLTFFIFLYNTGIGPVPWIILAEVFPPKIKTTATSLISSFNWFLSFIITKYVGFFLYTIGLSWSCWFFSASCLCFTFFVKYFVIETKKKTLEEIQVIVNK